MKSFFYFFKYGRITEEIAKTKKEGRRVWSHNVSMVLSKAVVEYFLCCWLRPRLGTTVNRLVAVGLLYLLFSSVEGILRVTGVSGLTMHLNPFPKWYVFIFYKTYSFRKYVSLVAVFFRHSTAQWLLLPVSVSLLSIPVSYGGYPFYGSGLDQSTHYMNNVWNLWSGVGAHCKSFSKSLVLHKRVRHKSVMWQVLVICI